MDEFKLEDIKDIHVGDIPAAKKGIIDSLNGKDLLKEEVPVEHMSSYKQGHQIGTEIENLLKGDQRDY
ncbi:hypothetical protein HBE96_19060 [Clostridium sp. P21]|uniref:Uncharacterized protein n=1 Tax=Clostridium muellerianum TaxID=2716538 RepID=A0A7Y0HR16_9CLOT|nr:hypothetical protein [Clostridium muellerianum]NMM64711.1 hypothetical protein [Clostridium muellerianum]